MPNPSPRVNFRRLRVDAPRVGGEVSTRRVLLAVALVLLLWIDCGIVWGMVRSIIEGKELGALGVPNIGLGFAAIQLLPLMVFAFLTYRAWDALRR